MKNFKDRLSVLIRSGVRIIEVVSYEWQRVHGYVNSIAKDLGREWYQWSNFSGVQVWEQDNKSFKPHSEELKDPMEILEFFYNHNSPLVLLLEDFFPFLQENNHSVIRSVREIARIPASASKTLIFLTPFSFIPKELKKEIISIELPLPDLKTLQTIRNDVIARYGLSEEKIEGDLSILEAALGLSVSEAEIAFSQAIVENNRLTTLEIPSIINEKERIIKQNGLLEYYHPEQDMESIGGLDLLKIWLQKRGRGFSSAAKDYGLDIPKGVLFLGVQGCGKSLAAKAIAKTWQFPLLRFDMGKVMGGIVGESERNIRSALTISEAIAPCILWIDEIEKGFAGLQSSGATDGGTTSRVLGTFLTWMQEKKDPVFVVATANDISQLPPELLRKGRMDEIFFVDLPGFKSRKEILKIHLKRKDKDPDDFDLTSLAKHSSGFSGAELEEAVKEAMFNAFDEGREVINEDIQNAFKQIVPLVTTMGESIKALRKWATVRARLASSEEGEELTSELSSKVKELPRLKQEIQNPFMS